ncbi:MAG: GGDEF domain-containing protein [Candidatus Pacebacteria bacterium]|nr:GGDEF domain-containing protein [Candidatus Paceibacterota bacterium]
MEFKGPERRLAPQAIDTKLVDYSTMRKLITEGKAGYKELRANTAIPLDERNALAFELAEILDQQVIELQGQLALDDLTQLLNRVFLKSILKSYLKQLSVHREGESREDSIEGVMVIFLDVNAFKSINDNYGHPVGDRALIAVAQRLREVTRPSDSLFRISGDEFMVVMPVAHKKDAEASFARVQTEINKSLSVEARGKRVPINISMGHRLIEEGDEEAVARIIEEADNKMYEDKKGIKK